VSVAIRCATLKAPRRRGVLRRGLTASDSWLARRTLRRSICREPRSLLSTRLAFSRQSSTAASTIRVACCIRPCRTVTMTCTRRRMLCARHSLNAYNICSRLRRGCVEHRSLRRRSLEPLGRPRDRVIRPGLAKRFSPALTEHRRLAHLVAMGSIGSLRAEHVKPVSGFCWRRRCAIASIASLVTANETP
jgi:hypothetical protein